MNASTFLPKIGSGFTRKRIRRGIFKSVDELKRAIMNYLENHNGQPKPYDWTKTAVEIFSEVARAKQALESRHSVAWCRLAATLWADDHACAAIWTGSQGLLDGGV